MTNELISDIPSDWRRPDVSFDYERRVAHISMRDGITLKTIILLPKGAAALPILLARTPYDAETRAGRSNGPYLSATVPLGHDVFAADGYILVYQDHRGKHGSTGDFVEQRPPIGPLNPTDTDDTTDAWDTIEWLVHNVPECNGRVGMTGSSYDGWSVVMALLDPHPALAVAAPQSPMIDGWMGDDWFHHGAFRQASFDHLLRQNTTRGKGSGAPRPSYDDYENFLRAGSAGDWARSTGIDQLPFFQRLVAHPAYDAFWQGQALDKFVAQRPSKVPTMWMQGLWDQEDMYGAIQTWERLAAAGHADTNYLVLGPWRHSQMNFDGSSIGSITWDGDTAGRFRRDVLLPFFNKYLKDIEPARPTPKILIYNTGLDRWDEPKQWPSTVERQRLYMQGDFGLSFDAGNRGSDAYTSDPAKPVPFVPRPLSFTDEEQWKTWLVQDQRFASDRPDVLTYETEVLTESVSVQGIPEAHLFARTTGSDADWVVKLIDVYPGVCPERPKMGGYQLAISLEIFRGRYRDSFEHPSAIPQSEVQEYRFRLPAVNHVFKPGHRIMVQIQSSLFPVYDRNPQTYLDNIFLAQSSDYQKAVMTIERGGEYASSIVLPVQPSVESKR